MLIRSKLIIGHDSKVKVSMKIQCCTQCNQKLPHDFTKVKIA